jgi:hypothetical protein
MDPPVGNVPVSFSDFYQSAVAFYKKHPKTNIMIIYYRGSIRHTDADVDVFTDSTKLKPWLDKVDRACALRQEPLTGNEFLAFKYHTQNGFCQRVF